MQPAWAVAAPRPACTAPPTFPPCDLRGERQYLSGTLFRMPSHFSLPFRLLITMHPSCREMAGARRRALPVWHCPACLPARA